MIYVKQAGCQTTTLGVADANNHHLHNFFHETIDLDTMLHIAQIASLGALT
jgi:hypothetical protein